MSAPRRAKGTGSLSETSPGRWRLRVKGQSAFVKASSFGEAEIALNRWIDELGLVRPAARTMAELLEEYVERSARRRRPRSQAEVERLVRDHLIPNLGDWDPLEVTAGR